MRRRVIKYEGPSKLTIFVLLSSYPLLSERDLITVRLNLIDSTGCNYVFYKTHCSL